MARKISDRHLVTGHSIGSRPNQGASHIAIVTCDYPAGDVDSRIRVLCHASRYKMHVYFTMIRRLDVWLLAARAAAGCAPLVLAPEGKATVWIGMLTLCQIWACRSRPYRLAWALACSAALQPPTYPHTHSPQQMSIFPHSLLRQATRPCSPRSSCLKGRPIRVGSSGRARGV